MPKVSEAYLASRRQHILDAAAACFARKGFHQTTTDEICREAGVSPGALYNYFSGKEEIIRAVTALDKPDERLNDLVSDMEANGEFLRLNALLRYWFARLERPGIDTVMKMRVRGWAEALQNPQVEEEVLGRWKERLDTGEVLIHKSQKRGEINPELDARAAAQALQSVLDGFVLQWTIDPDVDIWKYLDVVLALFGGFFWQGEQEQKADGQLSGANGNS
jgi:AcrR family transcriptional regulator